MVNAWAFPVEPTSAHHAVYLLTLASVLAALAATYSVLYASDPGFLEHQPAGNAARLSAIQQLQIPGASSCPYCGCLPTARSKHSKSSGQCVHKFDHFCWWLSTDIGAPLPGCLSARVAHESTSLYSGSNQSFRDTHSPWPACIWKQSIVHRTVPHNLQPRPLRLHDCRMLAAQTPSRVDSKRRPWRNRSYA